MSHSNLASFIKRLEQEKQLKRITVQVSTDLEITEIAHQAVIQGLPAILFENVQGSSYPLAINLLASEKRIELALGRHPEQIGEELVNFAEEILPPTPRSIWKNKRMLLRLVKMLPRKTLLKPAVRHREQSPVNLNLLPALKCWPKDGGRFITLPVVISRSPKNNKPNMGIYRMQIFDSNTTGMHMQIQKGGGFHYAQSQQLGRDLPMAVAIGTDPALIISAITALPEDVDELSFSGFLRGSRTRVFKTSDNLVVPAESEFLIEGTVPTDTQRIEGPFGDHFGHYSEAALFPVFRVSRISHRSNPIYTATIVGKPPMEDKYIGDASQMIVGKLIKTLHKEINDIWAYYEAGFHNLLVISIEERYQREAVKTALGILGQGQLSLTKTLICVNSNVNPRDPSAVLQAIARNFNASTDFRLIERTSMDTLDFTGESMHRGSKMVINATEKQNNQNNQPTITVQQTDLPSGVLEFRLLQNTLLVVKVKDRGRIIVNDIVNNPKFKTIKIVVAVSPDINIHNRIELISGIFTRFDCATDIIFSKLYLQGIMVYRSGVMGIDATWKNGYQEPLEMDPDIQKKVRAKWQTYWKKY